MKEQALDTGAESEPVTSVCLSLNGKLPGSCGHCFFGGGHVFCP